MKGSDFMKKLLYAHLVLQIVAAILNFIALMSSSVFYAIVLTPISLLGVVIPIAILKNMENSENLNSEVFYLRSRINALEKAIKGKDEDEAPTEREGDVSFGNWKCVKCGTVNKQGTTRCEGCKAAYSLELNPTQDPNKKKKLNRWGI